VQKNWGLEEEVLAGTQTDHFRQKLKYSVHFHIVGVVWGSRIALVVCSLPALSLPLLPSSVCAAFLFAPVLAFRLLLSHFVPLICLQASSAWFILLCTEAVVQKLYFYSALLLVVVHPSSEAGLNLCRAVEESFLSCRYLAHSLPVFGQIL